MTKNEFCMHLVYEFAQSASISFLEVNKSHIPSSSSLAVALDYLGLIYDVSLEKYANTRSGTFLFCHTFSVLTVREMIDYLPESSENEFSVTTYKRIEEMITWLEKMTFNQVKSVTMQQLYGSLIAIRNKQRLQNLFSS